MVLVLHDIRGIDNFLIILRDKILISVTRFEKLEDDRIKICRGHKRKPYLLVKEVQVDEPDCIHCDVFQECEDLGRGDPLCELLERSGIECPADMVFKVCQDLRD